MKLFQKLQRAFWIGIIWSREYMPFSLVPNSVKGKKTNKQTNKQNLWHKKVKKMIHLTNPLFKFFLL